MYVFFFACHKVCNFCPRFPVEFAITITVPGRRKERHWAIDSFVASVTGGAVGLLILRRFRGASESNTGRVLLT